MNNDMTFRYKQMAMKWLTGKMDIIPSINVIRFDEKTSNTNNMGNLMGNLYFPFGYEIEGIVQGKTSKGDNTEYSVVYGNYSNEAQTDNYGFIIIFDEKYNLIQLFRQYSNGEYFGDIKCLNVGSDGRFYLVEKDRNGYLRFVLLNNILAKSPTQEEYQVVMRQTYRFEDQNIFTANPIIMTKHPQNATYLMVQLNTTGNKITTTAVQFTINVGATNEWKYYETSYTASGIYFWLEKNDLLASWNENNELTFKTIYCYTIGQHAYYSCVTKPFNSDTLTIQNYDLGAILNSQSDVNYVQGIIKNFDTGYISLYYTNTNNTNVLQIYRINLSNTTYQLIKTIENPITDGEGIRLLKKDNDIFFFYVDLIPEIGLIINDKLYTTEVPNYQSSGDLFLLSVQNQFNLYTMYVQKGNKVYINKLIYIDKDNNGVYQDLTSMNPYYATLYDENDSLIYARTLYNKSIIGQKTTSVFQVPNQFINNINITKENLYGNTYLSLIMSEETYQKNQYEEVYFNFINSWVIQNQNDENNTILNPIAASRFNNSISQINDFNNCQCTKYKVNFDDDTSMIYNLDPSQIILSQNEEPFLYTYTFNVYVPSGKTALSIELISQDEETSYQTIDNLNLTSEKLYKLTQDVYVV